MPQIILADDGVVFDGTSLETRPLGGAETAVISVAEALANRGHQVTVYNRCEKAHNHNGVDWCPLTSDMPHRADLYIANRSDKLIGLVPDARAAVFWLHNAAQYILKWRYLSKLAVRRPKLIFLSDFHKSTCPAWVIAGRRLTVPLGVSEVFREMTIAAEIAPPPLVLSTSNPRYGLDPLLNIWREHIHPAVPGAELHIHWGAGVYGVQDGAEDSLVEAPLQSARESAAQGISVHPPVTKVGLAEKLAASRAMLYWGLVPETFSLAIAEAQAVGVPCVVRNIGSMPERVSDGVTGFVVDDQQTFATCAIQILTDDDLWRRLSNDARRQAGSLTWDRTAAGFEALIPGFR